jgi:omega-amidase
MKVLGLQFDIAWEDRRANFRRVEDLLDAHGPPPNSLVVLPEMFSSGFTMNVKGVAEDSEGETATFLGGIARERGIYVLGGAVAKASPGRGWNQALAFTPDGKESLRYRKLYPFSPGGEDRHYDAGDGVGTFQWEDVLVAPFICYDLRFPEAFRMAMLEGSGLFVVIANWPAARARQWEVLLRARAIENQAYVVGVNRCGQDPNHSYAGRSMIIDPLGELVQGVGDEEGVLSGEVEPKAVKAAREAFPCLHDVRAEFLGRPASGKRAGLAPTSTPDSP